MEGARPGSEERLRPAVPVLATGVTRPADEERPDGLRGARYLASEKSTAPDSGRGGYGSLYGDCVRSDSSGAHQAGAFPWPVWSVIAPGRRCQASGGPSASGRRKHSAASETHRWPQPRTPCSREWCLGSRVATSIAVAW
jgi:hypothetical protein